MQPTPVALDARVSSEQPAEAQTIARQVAAWRERVTAAGLVWPAARPLLDEGESGATWSRPARERWRDGIAGGAVDRVSGHAPARLARTDAYHVLRGDELRRAGVEVLCRNRAWGQSPADARLLQVPGLSAAEERAQILERPLGGKRHAAQGGVIQVLSGAPSGYRSIAQ